jgi:ABC-type Fe3+-citrate transport system substrate-binding protein
MCDLDQPKTSTILVVYQDLKKPAMTLSSESEKETYAAAIKSALSLDG